MTNEVTDIQVRAAAELAKALHGAQTRWNGESYFEEHCEVVAGHVRDFGEPNYAVALAYLHDVLEDTPTTVRMMARFLGLAGMPETFLEDLIALTKEKGEPYARYIQRLLRTGSGAALTVKSFDMQANWLDLVREGYPEKHKQRGDKYALGVVLINSTRGCLSQILHELQPFL